MSEHKGILSTPDTVMSTDHNTSEAEICTGAAICKFLSMKWDNRTTESQTRKDIDCIVHIFCTG